MTSSHPQSRSCGLSRKQVASGAPGVAKCPLTCPVPGHQGYAELSGAQSPSLTPADSLTLAALPRGPPAALKPICKRGWGGGMGLLPLLELLQVFHELKLSIQKL